MRAAFSALFWVYLALGCIPLYLVTVFIWVLTAVRPQRCWCPTTSRRGDILVLFGLGRP